MASDEPSYDATYDLFDSPVMSQVRRDVYGRDFGQHSWVTVEELEHHIDTLALAPTSRLLDFGCGPGGPLTFVIERAACFGLGIDVSRPALASARVRITAAGLGERITVVETEAGEPLPAADASIDAAMALDVILHVPDRIAVFREIARVLKPGGRYLFTDAGVLTGPVSVGELMLRAPHGPTQVVPVGVNECLLAQAGFRDITCRDRTDMLAAVASRRLASRQAHRAELEALEGAARFARQLQYLETVAGLAVRGALSRFEYVAVSG